MLKDEDSWYSANDLQSYFNIDRKDLNKYLKQSFLKNRVIQNDKGKVYFRLFLLKDNKTVLPPKELLKSRMITVIREGEEYYTTEYWYEYADLKLLKKLMKYKISLCLTETLAKQIQGGKFLVKKMGVNPLFLPKN